MGRSRSWRGSTPDSAAGRGSTRALMMLLPVLLAVVARFVNSRVSEPYMDEIFHVPQAQRFCRRDYTHWDPKITTFPGVYLLSVAIAEAGRAVGALLGRDGAVFAEAACSLASLRALNVMLSLVVVSLVKSISAQLHPRASPSEHALRALAVALYPTHFFFAFLYYTDVAALASALLVLLLVIQNRPVAAAAAGAASILVRQTNAVWLAASLGLYALLALPQRPRRGHSSALGGQGAHQHQGPASWYSPAPGAAPVGPLAALVQALPAAAPPEALAALALRLIPGVAVLFSVAAFFVWNGGVTVGDRDAHRPRAHWAQLCYCTAAVFAALFPTAAHPRALQRLGRSLATFRGVAAALALFALALLAVHQGTVAHPYLLADNRHFSFYLWKDVLNRSPEARYALAPAYAIAATSLATLPRAELPPLSAAGFCLAAALATVPAGLLDFRYFTQPVVTALLLVRFTRKQLILMCVAYSAANAAALWLFLFKPFKWPDGSVARFMW